MMLLISLCPVFLIMEGFFAAALHQMDTLSSGIYLYENVSHRSEAGEACLVKNDYTWQQNSLQWGRIF